MANDPIQDEEVASVETAFFTEDHSVYQPIALSSLRSNLRRGQVVGEYSNLFGACALQPGEVLWQSGVAELADDTAIEFFSQAMAERGIRITNAPTDLFGQAEDKLGRPTYLIGGILKDVNLNPCMLTGLLGNWETIGEGTVTIEWLVYDLKGESVVFRKPLDGYGKIESDRKSRDGLNLILEEAIFDSMRELARDREFHETIKEDPVASALAAVEDEEAAYRRNRIAVYVGEPSEKPIDDRLEFVVDSVVRIDGADGHGSGFLVSPMHVLTNAHVVDEAELVEVVFSTGKRARGEVLRKHDLRDVALIQIAPVSYPPLPIRLDLPRVGSDIYVIGSPARKTNQGTVTRGIVSRVAANPETGMDSLVYDATTHGGNSGGPVIDANGNVVAIHYAGQVDTRSGAGLQLNLGAPIADAFRRLGLDLIYEQPPPS